MRTNREDQAHTDKVTYDMYVDCGCSARETARQQGIAESTVRARVRRHSLKDHPRYVSTLSTRALDMLRELGLEK
jgi:IS30 family transposase